MQMQRLEDACGHRLFSRDRPAARLTRKGEALLGYARRLLSLQAEALADLSGRAWRRGRCVSACRTTMRPGLLPRILTRFAAEHPRIETEITVRPAHSFMPCWRPMSLILRSSPAHPTARAGQLFVSRAPGLGDLACEARQTTDRPCPSPSSSRIAWRGNSPRTSSPKSSRPFRIAYSSPHLAALLAVTEAGLAVAAMPAGSVPKSCKILDARDGYPALPALELGLIRNTRAASPAIDALADCITALAAE